MPFPLKSAEEQQQALAQLRQRRNLLFKYLPMGTVLQQYFKHEESILRDLTKQSFAPFYSNPDFPGRQRSNSVPDLQRVVDTDSPAEEGIFHLELAPEFTPQRRSRRQSLTLPSEPKESASWNKSFEMPLRFLGASAPTKCLKSQASFSGSKFESPGSCEKHPPLSETHSKHLRKFKQGA